MKTIAVLAGLLLSIGSISAQQQIPSLFEGTYLSEDYLTNLAALKCHVCSLRRTIEKGIYEVIMIKDNTVYSNLKYHDQYALKTEEFSHNWTITDSLHNPDEKGHRSDLKKPAFRK